MDLLSEERYFIREGVLVNLWKSVDNRENPQKPQNTNRNTGVTQTPLSPRSRGITSSQPLTPYPNQSLLSPSTPATPIATPTTLTKPPLTIQELHFFLFSDLLVYCSPTNPLSSNSFFLQTFDILPHQYLYQYKGILLLDKNFSVKDVGDINGFPALEVATKKGSFIFGASTREEKLTWIEEMARLRNVINNIRIQMEGMLVKRGKKVKNWKPRYFKLFSGDNLAYYATKNDQNPLGEIELDGYSLRLPSFRKRNLMIELHHIIKRCYFLQAPTLGQLQLWISKLSRTNCRISADVIQKYFK